VITDRHIQSGFLNLGRYRWHVLRESPDANGARAAAVTLAVDIAEFAMDLIGDLILECRWTH
jgi:hypothetical protein